MPDGGTPAATATADAVATDTTATAATARPPDERDGRLVALADQPAERHRLIAATFTDRVLGTRDWDMPTPVAEWAARDVVRHLCEWFPGFLAAGTGLELERGPSADDDPVAAWRVHADAVQRLLDDPATAGRLLRNPHIGELPLAGAIDQFYTVDIFMHTWDLSRATGQDDRLDPGLCAVLLAGMEPMEDVIRGSGQYGTRVDVPPEADPQTRLLGFIGRDPAFTPAPAAGRG
nr:TIGR03086 family metal-binding protein [Frankia nepalensis]